MRNEHCQTSPVQTLFRERGDLLALMAAYGAAALLIPTLAGVALGDDWIYSWSSARFATDGVIEVLPISGPNAVFEAIVGGSIGLGRAPSLGALRLVTVALSGASAIALWSILEARLSVRRIRGLAVASYLFNPLMMSLSFSFMTDAHALALMVIAAAFYDRGMRGDRPFPNLVLGGAVAAVAYLSRPHALLIVGGAVLTIAVIESRWDARRLAACSAIPLVVVVLHLLWRGGPSPMQSYFLDALLHASSRDHAANIAKTVVTSAFFVGLFAAPLLVGVWRPGEMRRPAMGVVAPPLLLAAAVWGPIPFHNDWIGSTGVGAGSEFSYMLDDPSSFAWFSVPWLGTLTIGGVVFGASFLDRLAANLKRAAVDPLAVLAITCIALSVAGVVASSMFFDGSPPNRYFLSLLPWVIIVATLVVPIPTCRLYLGWGFVICLGCISVLGLHDSLSGERATWDLASQAVDAGIPIDRLSAGAGWDGYHFGPETALSGSYDLGFIDNEGTWWLRFYAPQIEPEYLIVLYEPPPELQLIDQLEYSRWGWGPGQASLLRVPVPEG